MSEVFISYRRDRGSYIASFFESHLNSKGFECVIDVSSRYTGDFQDFINNEVLNSKLFILIVTEESITRMVNKEDNSFKEVDAAYKAGIPILPIIVEGVDMFEEIELNYKNLSESIINLKYINCRFYKHELREDTLTYIVELMKDIRKKSTEVGIDFAVRGEADKFELPEVLATIVDEFNKEVRMNNKKYLFSGKMVFNNKAVGKCRIISDTGEIIEGVFNISNTFGGTIKQYKDQTLIYEGDVIELLYDGKGKLITDEYIHEGEFSKGFCRGQGTRNYRDKTSISGYWIKDAVTQNGIARFPDGVVYRGKIEGKKIADGYGTLSKEGINYSGYFRNGKISNEAICDYGTAIVIGNLNDQMQVIGNGYILNKYGDIFFKGKFELGEAEGEGVYYITKNTINDLLTAIPSLAEELLKGISEEHKTLTMTVEHKSNEAQDQLGFVIRNYNGEIILSASPSNSMGMQQYTIFDTSGRIVNKFMI